MTEIFKRLKNYIDGGIFVLSVENYYFNENIEILKKIHTIIGKSITNFLVILNKLDLADDKRQIIENCRANLLQKFEDFTVFNINFNTFVPISAIKLENELLMSENFSNLIKYLFYEYNNLELNKNNTTFISYLEKLILPGNSNKSILTAQNLSIHEIKSEVGNFNNRNDVNEINNEIKEIIKDINFSKGKDINLGISPDDIDEDPEEDDEDDENTNDSLKPGYIIKMIYILHEKDELTLPPRSKETNDLLNYFSLKNYEIKNKLISSVNKNIDNNPQVNNEIISQLEVFFQDFERLINRNQEYEDLSFEIETLIRHLKISNNIYIPFLGPSNSGKSTIINTIIGKELLPTKMGACTKRCVIIKYKKEEPTIKKIIFKEEKKKYYSFEEKGIIGFGETDIYRTLAGLNDKYNEKEEDSFYCIETRIKLFDDIKLDDDLKKKINLIDFPGYCDDNIYETKIYKNVMTMCNSFIFVVKNSVIKEERAKTFLDSIFQQAKVQKRKLSSEFIKSCLFIFNNFEKKIIDNNNLDTAKKDIKDIIGGINNLNDIKLIFYNALSYTEYSNFSNYFFDLDKTFKDEYDNYNKSNTIGNFFLHPFKTLLHKYNDYLLDKIEEKRKNIDIKFKYKTQNINNIVENKVNDCLKKYENDVDKKKSEKIIKNICFVQENIKEYKPLKESNIDKFQNGIDSMMKFVNKCIDLNKKTNISNFIKILDSFFDRKNDNDKPKDSKLMNEFTTSIKNIIGRIKSLKSEIINTIEKIKKEYKENVLKFLDRKKSNLEELLKTQKYNDILNNINEEIKNNIDGLMQGIQNLLDGNDSQCNKMIEEAKSIINNFSNAIHIENSDFKQYIANNITNGEKSDLIKSIYNEIEGNCESLKNIYSQKGFMNWLYSLLSKKTYLMNIIEMVFDKFSTRIEFVIDLIKSESENYLDEINRTLNQNLDSATTNFNEIWEKLSESYKEIKKKINNNGKAIKVLKKY